MYPLRIGHPSKWERNVKTKYDSCATRSFFCGPQFWLNHRLAVPALSYSPDTNYYYFFYYLIYYLCCFFHFSFLLFYFSRVISLFVLFAVRLQESRALQSSSHAPTATYMVYCKDTHPFQLHRRSYRLKSHLPGTLETLGQQSPTRGRSWPCLA